MSSGDFFVKAVSTFGSNVAYGDAVLPTKIQDQLVKSVNSLSNKVSYRPQNSATVVAQTSDIVS